MFKLKYLPDWLSGLIEYLSGVYSALKEERFIRIVGP